MKLKINKLHLYALNEITTKNIIRNVKIFIEKQILIKITQFIIKITKIILYYKKIS